jgi:hypothetical protein
MSPASCRSPAAPNPTAAPAPSAPNRATSLVRPAAMSPVISSSATAGFRHRRPRRRHPGRLLALSLVRGGWTVDAGPRRAPPGNPQSQRPIQQPRFLHLPQPAPLRLRPARLRLHAGGSRPSNSVAPPCPATPTSSPRACRLSTRARSPSAGAGGVELGNDVILFPARHGQPSITTTDGGGSHGTKLGRPHPARRLRQRHGPNTGPSAISASPTTPQLLSISRRPPNPCASTFAGDLTGILLGLPKRAEIHVGGNLINSRSKAQNLRPRRHPPAVGGDIRNRNEFTSFPFAGRPRTSPPSNSA